MSKLKKTVLIVFTLLFVMNLQVNTSLTEGMNGNFSLTQLVENMFFLSAYACTQEGNCYEGGLWWCRATQEYVCTNIETMTECDCDDGGWPYPCMGGTICIFI